VSLGDALAVQGRTGEAEASYQDAYEVLHDGAAGRKAAVIWRQVADRLVRSGRPELALDAYQRALDTVGVRSAAPATVARPMEGEQLTPWSPGTTRSGSVIGT
jgi:tetratricopeptide (TPR) repeat protein